MRKCMGILAVICVIAAFSSADQAWGIDMGRATCSDKAVLDYFFGVTRGAKLNDIVTENVVGQNVFCSATFVYPKSDEKYSVDYSVKRDSEGKTVVRVIRWVSE